MDWWIADGKGRILPVTTGRGFCTCEGCCGKIVLAVVAFEDEEESENELYDYEKQKAGEMILRLFRKTGGYLLSRKLYNHYHRQGCV